MNEEEFAEHRAEIAKEFPPESWREWDQSIGKAYKQGYEEGRHYEAMQWPQGGFNPDEAIRFRCLELVANNLFREGLDARTIVINAKAFYDFVKGNEQKP